MAEGVRRFQVMALLQAARAYRLGLRLDEAKSWGLSRAIFYAAARHGFRKRRLKPNDFYVLGGERANLAAPGPKGMLRFQMGGQVLSPHDFERQIMARFGDRWNEAWHEALDVIDESDSRDLQNQQRFFNSVYKPRRDELAEKYSTPAPKSRAKKTAKKRLSLVQTPKKTKSQGGAIRLVSKTRKAA